MTKKKNKNIPFAQPMCGRVFFMKDGLVCGMLIGLIAGALLYKHNPQAKELVNNSEEAIKKELKNISS